MTLPQFPHQCTAHFKIHNYSRATPALQKALEDLPRLAALASHETGLPITGEVDIRIMTHKSAKKTMRSETMKSFTPLIGAKNAQRKVSNQEMFNTLVYGKAATYAGTTNPVKKEISLINTSAHRDPELRFKEVIFHEMVHIAQQSTALSNQYHKIAHASTKAAYVSLNRKDARKLYKKANFLSKIAEGQANYLTKKVMNEGKITSSPEFINSDRQPQKQTILNKMRYYYAYEAAKKEDPYIEGALMYKDALMKDVQNNTTDNVQGLLNTNHLEDIAHILKKIDDKPVKNRNIQHFLFLPLLARHFFINSINPFVKKHLLPSSERDQNIKARMAGDLVQL